MDRVPFRRVEGGVLEALEWMRAGTIPHPPFLSPHPSCLDHNQWDLTPCLPVHLSVSQYLLFPSLPASVMQVFGRSAAW